MFLAIRVLITSLLCHFTFAWSPTNSYTPGNVSCPAGNQSFIRHAGQLSPNESAWITERQKFIKPQLIQFLDEGGLDSFDASSFLSNTTITVAMAFSGGGYRAMLCGAGQFAAFDNRTINSTTGTAPLGGLVQASTYLAGLSGGSWLVGSLVLNNFTSVQDLQGSSDVWNLENSIIDPGGVNIFSDASYWDNISNAVEGKSGAGFNTSLTDIWGRGLSQQFIDLKEGGPALTWDDIRNYPVFQSHEMPFPIVVSDGRAPNTTIISTNSTVFEFTPFELGSWDPSVYAFTDVKYLGTSVQNGENNGTCIAGFDNAGFVMGTSSSLFNQFILQLNSTGITGIVYNLAQSILQDLGSDSADIAIYAPNPFKGAVQSNISTADWLTLVDGGEDNQNVPLHPLIQPERSVDVIFAFDNSADTNNSWPDGASLVATYERQFGIEGNGTIFPYVPDKSTFINSNLTSHPTFFGCNTSNLTSLFPSDLPQSERHYPPLIVYLANYPYSYFSNTSTFKLSYTEAEVAGIIQNGYNVATQQNGTIDNEWATCVRCAIIQREVERRGQNATPQCQNCYSKYCWNGQLNSKAVNTSGPLYNPSESIKSSAYSIRETLSQSVVALVMVFGILSLM